MTPWSVSPIAGCSNPAARSTSASMLQAPSSSEYSEWTWRWAHGETAMGSQSRVGARRVRGAHGARNPLFAGTGRAAPRVLRGRYNRVMLKQGPIPPLVHGAIEYLAVVLLF